MPHPATRKLQALFPECTVTDEEIDWNGGEYVSGYAKGYKHQITLDGEFTAEQLAALAEWMLKE